MEHGIPSAPQMTDESNALIVRAHKLFKAIGRDASGLPDNANAQERPISIVFAGQYSAGKSSIVKALTGNGEIKIGHGVTTQAATSYTWHGMLLIDTPGIGTGLGAYKEHDETSLDAINESDVLVYVVTSDGFEYAIAKEFRNLIIDGDRAGETILVVNKMMECAEGNTPEQRSIIADDLADITNPYSPEALHTVYIDARSYLDSIACKDENPQMSARFYEDSNMGDLELALEEVIRGSGAVARLTTPLYQTIREIDKAVEDLDDVGDNKTFELKRELRSELASIANMKSDIFSRSQSMYTDAASKIKDEGRGLADVINGCESESDAEAEITASSQRVLETETKCIGQIDKLLQDGAEKLKVSIESLFASWQKELDVSVEYEQDQRDVARAVLDQLVQKGALEKRGNKLIALSIGDATESGLKY